MMVSSRPQAQHYDEILEDYDRHYYDRHSLLYRQRFILSPLLEGVDLRGKRVADLASGSGETTIFLEQQFAGVECTGFDVSSEACRRYSQRTGRPAHEFDLTAGRYTGETFDAAIIMGGLHHCVTDLEGALRTVASMLRSGGILMLFEPNREYVLESARQLWYRLDRYFDEGGEAALSHGKLLALAHDAFECRQVRYFGGPAFFLVYNSLVFRIPPPLKAAIAPVLMHVEAGHNRLALKWLCASFLARWVRK